MKLVKLYMCVLWVYESIMIIGFEDKGDFWYYEIFFEDNKMDFRILEYLSLEVNLVDVMFGFYIVDRGISVLEIG